MARRLLSQGLAQRRELKYASWAFDTVEINGTFYSYRNGVLSGLGRRDAGELHLRAEGQPYVTYMLKLKNVERPLAATGGLVEGRYAGNRWRIKARAALVYFDNDAKVRVPFDAMRWGCGSR